MFVGIRRVAVIAVLAALSVTYDLGAAPAAVTAPVAKTNLTTRFDALRDQYGKAVTQIEQANLYKAQDALTAYGKGLDAALTALKKQGNLDAFLLAQEEKKRFEAEKIVPEVSGKKDLAEIDRLAGEYKKALASARDGNAKATLALNKRYELAWDSFVKESVQANEIELAKKAKEELTHVRSASVSVASADAAATETSPPKDEPPVPAAKRTLPQPLRRGLVLWYPFDRDERGRATDVSVRKNSGEVKGARWTSKGKVGGGYQFDGNDDYIDSKNVSLVKGFSGVTLSVWACASANVQYAGIATACSQNSKDVLMIGEGPAGKRQASFYVGNGARYEGAGSLPSGELEPGAWHHMAGTWKSPKSGGDGLLRIYFDGILSGTSAQPLDGVIAQTTSLKIGWDDVPLGSPENRHFNGLIDEVMVYDRALTEEEVVQIYDAQK